MILSFIILLFSSLSFIPAVPPVDCISNEEKELFELINNYRKEKGLSKIPLSSKLTMVAQLHARDLSEHYDFNPGGECNPHSWSDQGDWTPCCYTNDHAMAECMWQKPMEIAGYPGSGYEIAYYQSNGANPDRALSGWKTSKGHNPIIINKGMWKQVTWNAIGVGIYKEYAVVWFGEEKDATASPVSCD